MSENFGRKGMLQVLSPVCALFFPSSLSYPPLFSFAHPCPIGNRRTVRRIFERYRDNGRLGKKLASKEKIFLFFNPLLPPFLLSCYQTLQPVSLSGPPSRGEIRLKINSANACHQSSPSPSLLLPLPSIAVNARLHRARQIRVLKECFCLFRCV